MNKLLTAMALACLLGPAAQAADAPKIDNLLRSDSEVAEGAEIIVSVIEVGPHFALPKHYHPGEEFVYLLEGSATVWQQGKPDLVLQAGDIFKIPLEQVHTAMTSDSRARVIVFRVHRKGQPVHVPVQ